MISHSQRLFVRHLHRQGFTLYYLISRLQRFLTIEIELCLCVLKGQNCDWEKEISRMGLSILVLGLRIVFKRLVPLGVPPVPRWCKWEYPINCVITHYRNGVRP